MYRIQHISGWTDIVCDVAPENVRSHLEAAAKTFNKPITEFSAVEGTTADPIGASSVTMPQPPVADTRTPEQKLLDALRAGNTSGVADLAVLRALIALAKAR